MKLEWMIEIPQPARQVKCNAVIHRECEDGIHPAFIEPTAPDISHVLRLIPPEVMKAEGWRNVSDRNAKVDLNSCVNCGRDEIRHVNLDTLKTTDHGDVVCPSCGHACGCTASDANEAGAHEITETRPVACALCEARHIEIAEIIDMMNESHSAPVRWTHIVDRNQSLWYHRARLLCCRQRNVGMNTVG
jgi:ferredoxin